MLVDEDRARDAREFEPVIRAVAELSPRLDVIEPGWITLDARGPSRYFGGEAMFVVADWSADQVVGQAMRTAQLVPVSASPTAGSRPELAARLAIPAARTGAHRRRRLGPLLRRAADRLVAGVG